MPAQTSLPKVSKTSSQEILAGGDPHHKSIQKDDLPVSKVYNRIDPLH